jgi:glucose/arabinose dehydrogenase
MKRVDVLTLSSGQGLPNGYDGAVYNLLKGTTTNSTHWTMVAACSGCTSWQANDDSTAVVNGSTATFAWAYSTTAVQDPTNNASAFNVHTSVGHWTHDLSGARSSKFASWVSANLLAPAATSGPAGPASSTAPAPSTMATSVVSSAPKPSAGAKGAIPASCSGAGAAQFPGVLASGWKATKVLGGLTSPRSLVVDSQGNMLMVQSGKGISVHKMGADGCVTATKMLVSLNSLNHGIALSPDSKTLYASSMTQVYSWPYDAAAQTVGTRSTIITGMYNGGAHTTRTLLMGAHAPNLLVVSHGSNDNFDYAAGNPKTGRAIIKVFDITMVPSSGSYNYPNDGYLAGYGMRNEVGITFDGNNM